MTTRLLLLLILITGCNLFPCTTVLVSGKATPDGRPLLLKNRDSDEIRNRLLFFKDGKYTYYGLVNSKDLDGKEVWGGFNSAGFAIINSASYNLKINDTSKLADREGIVMKLALQQCATLEDFEQLLFQLPKPMGVEANFGVIDAMGGAAYYETDNYTFRKFDVNDPTVAPDGYLIRTNYSVCGLAGDGMGHIRYETTVAYLQEQFDDQKLDFNDLITELPRLLRHSLTRTDLNTIMPVNRKDTTFVWFQDYIPRMSTASAIVIQGIREGISADQNTMWIVNGFPLTSVAIPVWFDPEGKLPAILTGDEKGLSKLSEYSLQLKEQMCPSEKGIGSKYLNLALLHNAEGSGFRQILGKAENQIIADGVSLQNLMYREGYKPDAVATYYNKVSDLLESVYQSVLKSMQ